jgi:hypothetical protein
MQKKCFFIEDDFVSCNVCQLNYDASQPKIKSFCQEYSISINPHEHNINNSRALECPYWFPDFLSRDKCKTEAPESERWYEKDSIA